MGHEEKSGAKPEQETGAVCADCQRYFVIESGEKSFFEKKGLALPKRCKDCRAYRKTRRFAQECAVTDADGEK